MNAIEREIESRVKTWCPPIQKCVSEKLVVVGSGPAGMRFIEEVLARSPEANITLFGDEPYAPYNRVQLSSVLAGEVDINEITLPLPEANRHQNFQHIYKRIQTIDTIACEVEDQSGERYAYDKLVLATGSRPHEPNIPGVDQAGVYTFRNLKDTEYLYSRVARSRHVVVVGGGLLGVEAARALRRNNTNVTLVQQGHHLMNRQLDEKASAMLQQKIEALNIIVIKNSGVREIHGDGRVSGVTLRNKQTLECDTVLLCAGIRPRVDLARKAKLHFTKGILVNDSLQTSDQNIYAIGECCEHSGKVYGLVSPGYEQAAVAADVICGGEAKYLGSLEVSRLKVIGETVCSMGEVTELIKRPYQRIFTYRNKSKNIYRKIVIYKGKIIGAVGFGTWPEFRLIQEAYQSNRTLYPWNYLNFWLRGNIWIAGSESDIHAWPETTVVCQCNNITQGQLVREFDRGANTIVELQKSTGAGTVCGSCKPLLANLIGAELKIEKEKGWQTIFITSIAAMALATLIAFFPAISVSDTVQQKSPLEALWNDKFWKQVSGFSLIGLSFLAAFLSIRKRFKRLRLGDFAYWRLFHICMGFSCIAILIAHTGLSTGHNFNRIFMLNFLSIIAVGAIAGVSLSLSHQLSPNKARSLNKFWTWAHLILVWPFPILAIVHIITVYYF